MLLKDQLNVQQKMDIKENGPFIKCIAYQFKLKAINNNIKSYVYYYFAKPPLSQHNAFAKL